MKNWTWLRSREHWGQLLLQINLQCMNNSNHVLHPGGAVDVYLADLQNLSVIFGGIPDSAMTCVFVEASWSHEKACTVLSQGGWYVPWGVINSSSSNYKGPDGWEGTSCHCSATLPDSSIVPRHKPTQHDMSAMVPITLQKTEKVKDNSCATRPVTWSEITQEMKVGMRY